MAAAAAAAGPRPPRLSTRPTTTARAPRVRATSANNDADTDAAAPPTRPPPPPLALLLEVDGAVVDVVQQGHRVAFNRAFADLGLPPQAAYASAPAFEAALRLGGTGEALVAARLAQTNTWPAALLVVGEEEARRSFARRAHEAKQRRFAELVAGGGLPLRPDVERVIDAALDAGAVVALLAETASGPQDGVAGAALRALGEARAGRVRVLSSAGAADDDAGDDAASGGGNGGDDDDDDTLEQQQQQRQLRRAVARQKAAAAREFAARFGQSVGAAGGGAAPIDVSALTRGSEEAPASSAAAASGGGVSPAFLAAAAALLGASPARCACVAATAATVRAAAAAGMVSVAVPRQGAFDVSFPEAAAKFEAYGPGYLTWPRLAAMVEAARAAARAEAVTAGVSVRR